MNQSILVSFTDDLKKLRTWMRIIFIGLVIGIPLLIKSNAASTDLIIWWLLYTLVAGLVPLVVLAYLLYPALEQQDRAKKIVNFLNDKINNQIEQQQNGHVKIDDDEKDVIESIVAGFDDVYQHRYQSKNYLLPLTFLSVVLFSGFMLMFSTVYPLLKLIELDEFILLVPNEIFYGFIGGSMFALFSVVNRYRSADIPPGLVMQLGYHIILSSVGAYFIVEVSPEITDAIVAFSIGFIPYADLAIYIRYFAQRKFDISTEKTLTDEEKKRLDSDRLTNFRGMSPVEAERLKEERIFTVHNLAMSNPINLYISTSFNMSQIVEWINRAYLRMFVSMTVTDKLSPMGIQGAITMASIYDDYPNVDDDYYGELSNALNVSPIQVKSLVKRLHDDPKVKVLTMLRREFGWV